MPDNDDKNKKPDDPKAKKPDEGKDPNDDPEGGKKSEEDDDPEGGKKKEPEMIPKGKADQWYKDKKDAERRAEEAERKLADKDEDEKRKQGEFEELADKYKAESESKDEEMTKLKEQAEKDVEAFQTMLDSELESIPEDKRGLIPEDYSVRQKLSYIAANRAALEAVGGGKRKEKGQPDSDPSKKPSDELGQLEAEREELFTKSRESGGLMGQDAKRMRELTRKITELKKASK